MKVLVTGYCSISTAKSISTRSHKLRHLLVCSVTWPEKQCELRVWSRYILKKGVENAFKAFKLKRLLRNIIISKYRYRYNKVDWKSASLALWRNMSKYLSWLEILPQTHALKRGVRLATWANHLFSKLVSFPNVHLQREAAHARQLFKVRLLCVKFALRAETLRFSVVWLRGGYFTCCKTACFHVKISSSIFRIGNYRRMWPKGCVEFLELLCMWWKEVKPFSSWGIW